MVKAPRLHQPTQRWHTYLLRAAAQAIVRQQQEMSTQLPYQQQDWQQLWELQQPSHWSRQQQTWPPEAWQPGAWQPEAWQPVARSTYQCNYDGLAQNAWEGTRPYDRTWTSRRFASEPYRCERQSVFLANSSEKFLRLVRSIISLPDLSPAVDFVLRVDCARKHAACCFKLFLRVAVGSLIAAR